MPYIGRAPTSTATKIEDADQDTKIQVEESSDEDTIRFDIAGAEDFTMTANTLTALSGSTIATNTIAETTSTSGVTIDGLLIKDSTAAFADGAVATPSITNTGDLNTGVYFPAADTVGVVAGGTEQFRFGSSTTAAASKNVIINGSMQICQRAASTSGVGNGDSGYVGPDQWYFDESGTTEGIITVSQEAGGGVGGQDRWMKILCTTEEALGGSTDQMQMMQRLEAQNCVPLKNGATGIAETTISADIIIHADGSSGLSFPVKVAFSVHSQDGTARQCIGDMSIAANDTWERVSITLPADSTATFVSDTALGCTFNISLCGASGRNATNLTWANEDSDFNTSSSDNIMDQANNYIGVTRVQWEVGAIPTDFAYENVANILQKCQRYYWGGGVGTVGGAVSTSQAQFGVQYPVEMRAAPTAALLDDTFYVGDTAGAGLVGISSAIYSSVINSTGCLLYINGWSGGNALTQHYGLVIYNYGVDPFSFTAEL
jgi:hypothetical protein